MDQAAIASRYIPKRHKIETHGNVFSYQVSADELPDVCRQLHFEDKLRLKIVTATDERAAGRGFRIHYVYSVPGENVLIMPYVEVKDGRFPSITELIHEASGYERKIRSFFGLDPVGHPNPRPIILHENWPADVFPLRKDFDWQERPKEAKGEYQFEKVQGEGIYEIPVGPVHAGIIEPGHFRFSVAGEEIILLEGRLGYTHKGTEKLFEVLPLNDKVRLSERISGDASFTHSLAFCQALENLAGMKVPERAKYLRVIYSELERLANHCNDIGFIMQDAGYAFGGSTGMRLREVLMQWHERLTGSRFLRGVNVIGGVSRDIPDDEAKGLAASLEELKEDFDEFIGIAENSSSLLNRLEGTGRVDHQPMVDHGMLGVAARAIGIEGDARIDSPYAAYASLKFSMALEKSGDVKARMYVRVKEVGASFGILQQALSALPSGKIAASGQIEFQKDSLALGLAEGWRGEIVYFVRTDADGEISRVDVRDPSFMNWSILSHLSKGNIVPDFPLINKSFNLSYSGNDL